MWKEVLNSHLHVYFRSLISIGKHEHPAKGKQKGGGVQKETSPDKLNWSLSPKKIKIVFKNVPDPVNCLIMEDPLGHGVEAQTVKPSARVTSSYFCDFRAGKCA